MAWGTAAKLSSGVPLSDEDRWPWLVSLAALADRHARISAEGRAVIACSALKRSYRRVLRGPHSPKQIAIVRRVLPLRLQTLLVCPDSHLCWHHGVLLLEPLLGDSAVRLSPVLCALAGDAITVRQIVAGAGEPESAAGHPLYAARAASGPAGHARATPNVR